MLKGAIQRNILWLLAIGAAPAAADLVEFRFEGNVRDNALTRAPYDGIAVGAPVVLEYTFDTLTADSEPAGDVGFYSGAVTELSLRIGTVIRSADSATLSIADRATADRYNLLDVALGDDFGFGLFLRDLTGSALSSDALPTDLNLTDWDLAFGALSDERGTASLTLDWEAFAIVPEPGGVWLLLAGGVWAARRRS